MFTYSELNSNLKLKIFAEEPVAELIYQDLLAKTKIHQLEAGLLL